MTTKTNGLEVVEYVMSVFLADLNKGTVYSNNDLPQFLSSTLEGHYTVSEDEYNKILQLLKQTKETL